MRRGESTVKRSQSSVQVVIPYGRQWVDESDIAAVVEVLRSDWLTTGPRVEAFEKRVAEAKAKGLPVPQRASGLTIYRAPKEGAEIFDINAGE